MSADIVILPVVALVLIIALVAFLVYLGIRLAKMLKAKEEYYKRKN